MGDRVATLVSLSLTPLTITDGLARWDGRSERVPAEGTAVLFGRSIAARLPEDLSPDLALMVMDVCGAPALVTRVVEEYAARGRAPTVCVLGGAGKSGSLSLAAAARRRCRSHASASCRTRPRPSCCARSGLADAVVVADARSPLGLSDAVAAAGGPADVTVVCVDVPGCEQPAILATAQGGTIIYFSMATSFSAAALGAEGLAADVRMLVGNGYVPGHADLALDLLRSTPGRPRAVRGSPRGLSGVRALSPAAGETWLHPREGSRRGHSVGSARDFDGPRPRSPPMTRIAARRIAPAVVAGLALLAGGCASDDSTDTTAGSSPAASAAASASAALCSSFASLKTDAADLASTTVDTSGTAPTRCSSRSTTSRARPTRSATT